MKKTILCLAMIGCHAVCFGQAQTWDVGLNFVPVGINPDFGTNNNVPLNFFTNNNLHMTLGTNGVLRLNSLSGSGNRFLSADNNGHIYDYPFPGTYDYLRGDGTWQPFPSVINSFNPVSGTSDLFISPGSKLGIGNSAPVTELDVAGNGKVDYSLGVGHNIYLGPANDYGVITYYPATGNNPGVISFGAGGPVQGSNPPTWGGPNTPSPDPPLVSVPCADGEIPAPLSVNLMQNMLCVQKKNASNVNLGNINIGHTGINAFIETQGTNTLSPNAGDLFINSKCNRNVYVFGNGTIFGPTLSNVLAISGKVNITQNVQIGDWSSTVFSQPSSRLYVLADVGSLQDGIKVKHAGAGKHGVKIVNYSPTITDKSFGVFRAPNSGVDGNEIFSIQGEGRTEITASGTDALAIRDANNGNVNRFLVQRDGKTEITTLNPDAIVMKDASNNNVVNFKMDHFGNTFIGEGASTFGFSKVVIGQAFKNHKALALVDNSALPTINDFFSVYGSGYTEINVYAPNALPNQTNGVGHVFAIKDKVQNRDIFVVKQNGKAYAREVEISLATTFPDYVFDKEYCLKSIPEVDEYIRSNKHLPGFEKGEYYEKNGINVNDMFIKQQEKIEELTLYIIELEKRLQAVEKK